MRRIIGIVTTDHMSVGLVEENRVTGAIRRFPEGEDTFSIFQGMPAEQISEHIREQIEQTQGGQPIDAIGVALPGIIRNGVVEESPNLHQLKGFNMRDSLAAALRGRGVDVPILVCNDADVVAAGIAATRGHLDRLIRVWTLGNGIGFGRYPWIEGIWEGGHIVVTLDPKEQYCGCGGLGHLEGIMGHRAMRMRFLDMEPDEVFEAAREGDARCIDFVKMWHRALAAATASSIHMSGPGKFFITGPSAGFLDLTLLNAYTQEMVKMSALQGYMFEVVSGVEEAAVIGAAVNAERSAFGGCQ